MALRINDHLSIAEDEISLIFMRSTGAGGQNVNKVETAVQLRWFTSSSPSIDDRVRANLKLLAGRRLTKDGVAAIMSRSSGTGSRTGPRMMRLCALAAA